MKRQMHFVKIVLAIGFSFVVSSSQAATGEEWEYQGSMDMMGFKMPIKPVKACQEKDAPSAPPMEDNCKISDLRQEGNTSYFSFVCTGADAGSGTGTTTVTGTTLQSRYTLKTPDGDGTVTLNGKKIGDCQFKAPAKSIAGKPVQTYQAEASNQKAKADKSVANAQQQVAGLEKKHCGNMVQIMSPQAWFTSFDSCIKQKPAFCQRMKTDEGLLQFATTAASEGNMDPKFSLDTIGKECGLAAGAATQNKMCKLSIDGKKWNALKSFCTDQFQEQVMTHCKVGEQSELETILVSKNGPAYDELCKLADGGLAASVNQSENGTGKKALKAGKDAVKDLLKW